VRLVLDTNILVYAEGVNGTPMQEAALDLIGRLRREDVFVSVQAIGELFNVLTRKASRTPEMARIVILSWRDMFSLIDTSASVMLAAVDLAADHQLSIWDAIVMAAAAEGGCRLLLSQDLQDGFTWGGVTVTNPFSSAPHPLLTQIFEARQQ
jgi:predicted nucleic acid-binding protein